MSPDCALPLSGQFYSVDACHPDPNRIPDVVDVFVHEIKFKSLSCFPLFRSRACLHTNRDCLMVKVSMDQICLVGCWFDAAAAKQIQRGLTGAVFARLPGVRTFCTPDDNATPCATFHAEIYAQACTLYALRRPIWHMALPRRNAALPGPNGGFINLI